MVDPIWNIQHVNMEIEISIIIILRLQEIIYFVIISNVRHLEIEYNIACLDYEKC